MLGLGSLVLLAGFLYLVSQQSAYIFRMWDYLLQIASGARSLSGSSLIDYFQYVGFGPRIVYWRTAYRIFSRYPLFGVGLGNYAFHFKDLLPAIQIGYEPELLTRIVPGGARIVNAKNFLARLLAETGIFGTAAFVTFLVMLAGGGLYLWLSRSREEKFWGAGALLGVLAFVVDSFSYDSLAIPNPWIVFGLITGALTVYTNKTDTESEDEK